jgi:uncharacterized membrane protein
MERYIPTKNSVVPDLFPIDQKIICLLRDTPMTKEKIITALNEKYSVEQSLVYESVDVLTRKHIISSTVDVVDGTQQSIYGLERYAEETYFNTDYVGKRTGAKQHKAAILCIANSLWDKLTYCKIDLGYEYGKHADILVIHEASYKNDDGNVVYDLKTWGKVTAIEVEVDPTKHKEQVYENWKKNSEQKFDVSFVVFSDEHKQFIQDLLSAKGVEKDSYSILIMDEKELEKYYKQLQATETKGLNEEELKVVNILRDAPATVRKIQDSTNMSEEAVVRILNSLERKGIVERNYAEKRTSKVNLAKGELQRKRSRIEYFSLKGQENELHKEEKNIEANSEQLLEDDLSAHTDGELIARLKDPDCRDKDAIIIILENRGYRIKQKGGKVSIYKR